MICPPFKGASLQTISQIFGVNPCEYQPNGHTGVDFYAPYGTFLVSPEVCKVQRIITSENFNKDITPLSRGYGILLRSIPNPDRTYLHWHCCPIFPVNEGDTVSQGQPVAIMGNSGFVTQAGILVPVEIRTNAPYWGTHDHFEVRVNSQYVDPLKYIDFSIPIKYDIKTAILEILYKIRYILK